MRVAIHLRRTGDTGLLRAHKGPSELGAGLAIALGVAAPVLAIVDVLGPIGAPWMGRPAMRPASRCTRRAWR